MMNLALCISGKGRIAEALMMARAEGLINNVNFSVLTDRKSPISVAAEAMSVPFDMVDVTSFTDKRQFRVAFEERLISMRVDGAFLTFDWILSPQLVARLSPNLLNLHMSLLPLFKGRGAVRAALDSGMTFAGVTCHRVDEGVDTGPIIGQAVHAIEPGWTEADLGFALFRRAVPLCIQCLRWLCEGKLGPSVSGGTCITGARFNDGPFAPALDSDVEEFTHKFLQNRYPVLSR